jgi:valyl-tRNA synthetase
MVYLCLNHYTEEKWKEHWKEKKHSYFHENSDKPIYIIDTPPPFTNGALHMGQVFWVCYIDLLQDTSE